MSCTISQSLIYLYNWCGKELILSLGEVLSIDISSNHLVSEIPENIASMTKLNSLNLSRNNLWGKLPENFGQLKMFESLNLSRNQLSGRIPSSFSSLNFLSVLDLSYNNLSGRTPLSAQLQSFNSSQYMGNLGLCGPPVTQKCPGDETTQDPGITSGNKSDCNTEGDNDGLIYLGFYASIVLGFLMGFWDVYGTLLLKISWRYAYFQVLNDTKDWIYVTTALHKEKMQRILQR
ncbi:unnamed protein product [Prunus armeniaca]